MSKYTVKITTPRNAGTTWVVSVYRKVLFFKRLVTSDWFLDREQATRFAESLKKELTDSASLDPLISRQPGWTLRRPP